MAERRRRGASRPRSRSASRAAARRSGGSGPARTRCARAASRQRRPSARGDLVGGRPRSSADPSRRARASRRAGRRSPSRSIRSSISETRSRDGRVPPVRRLGGRGLQVAGNDHRPSLGGARARNLRLDFFHLSQRLNALTLQQLVYFRTAAALGSFNAAARALHCTQPAVSEQVRQLERELGVALFARGGRGLTLTSAGRAFLGHAERVAEAADDALASVGRRTAARQRVVTIGTFRNAPYYDIAGLGARFCAAHPERRLQLPGQNSADVATAVRGGDIEAGIVVLPVDDRVLDVKPLFRDEVLVLSADPERTRVPMSIERLGDGAADPLRRQPRLRRPDAPPARGPRAGGRRGARAADRGRARRDGVPARRARPRRHDRRAGRSAAGCCRPASRGRLAEPIHDSFALVTRPGRALSPGTVALSSVSIALDRLRAFERGRARGRRYSADEPRRLRPPPAAVRPVAGPPARAPHAHLGGAELWAKRDDCNSGLAFGGNKTRKLEYLVADALAQGCDTLVSIGGVQSNHTRQVAAVAARDRAEVRARAGELGRLARRRLRPRRQHPAQPDHGRRRAAGARRASGSASRRAGSRRSPTSRPRGGKPYAIPAGRVGPPARRARLRELGARGRARRSASSASSSTRSSSARSPAPRRPG